MPHMQIYQTNDGLWHQHDCTLYNDKTRSGFSRVIGSTSKDPDPPKTRMCRKCFSFLFPSIPSHPVPRCGPGLDCPHEELVAYIKSMKGGERVMEMGQSGMKGQTGTVEIRDGRVCIRWDTKFDTPGKMVTSFTGGARVVEGVALAVYVDHEASPICIACAEKLANSSQFPDLFWSINIPKNILGSEICSCGERMDSIAADEAASRVADLISRK